MCALNGSAAGLAASVALLCDVVVMADDAVIVDPHVKVGLVAGDGGAAIWPLLLGPLAAKRHLMLGDPLDGRGRGPARCRRRIVPTRRGARSAPSGGRRRLADIAPLAVGGTKQAVNAQIKQALLTSFDVSAALEIPCFLSAEHAAAVDAFTEGTETVTDAIHTIMTTRAIRRFTDRPVSREDLETCLRAAQQAPSGGNVQPQQYLVLTDDEPRRMVGEWYRKAFDRYEASLPDRQFKTPEQQASWDRTRAASRYLADHIAEAPAIVLFLQPLIPWGAVDGDGPMDIGRLDASVYPAVQNFCLAAARPRAGDDADDGDPGSRRRRARRPRRAGGQVRDRRLRADRSSPRQVRRGAATPCREGHALERLVVAAGRRRRFS